MFDAFKINKLSHLSFKTKSLLSVYPWKNCKPESLTQLKKPLKDCKVSIVTSAGLYIKNKQKRFDNTIKGGDYSFRKIPQSVEIAELYDAHRSRSFDHQGIRSNPATVMPIPQLQELEVEGTIGAVNKNHYSVMGSLFSTGRFVKHTVSQIVNEIKADRVDCVLLVPV